MTVEHRLRIGDRNVLLVEGPTGWGECSPLPGYPCGYDAARAAAEEAATLGWPTPLRSAVPVNGFVAAASLTDEHASAVLCEYPSVKVKVGRLSPDDEVNRIARVRDLIGPTVGLRVDANGAWDVETAVATLTRLRATTSSSQNNRWQASVTCELCGAESRCRLLLTSVCAAWPMPDSCTQLTPPMCLCSRSNRWAECAPPWRLPTPRASRRW